MRTNHSLLARSLVVVTLAACGGDGNKPPDNTMAICGNGVVEAGEGCDDGNTDDGDVCLTTCVSATCGDGIVQAGVEACDSGKDNSDTAPDACRTNCTAARCGDGVKDSSDGCDDGNTSDGDACLTTCVSATCGDGFVQAGVEQCDAAADNSDVLPDACRTNCTSPRCGDMVIDTGEACDDANGSNTDVCLTICVAASCGDGFVQDGVDQCDDGPGNSDTLADACRTSCTSPRCGDAVTDTAEGCDDGNASDTDACRTTCTPSPCSGPLVGSYPFEETTGPVLDVSGCELHGTAGPGLVRGSSGVNLAATFGAPGAYVAIPGIVAESLSVEFTLEAWVFRNADAGGAIFALASGTGSEALEVLSDPVGRLSLRTNNPTCDGFLNWGTTSIRLANGGWSHVAVVHQPDMSPLLTDYAYYIDGQFALAALGGRFPFCVDPTDEFTLGAVGRAASQLWPGRIDEVKIWTTARSREEVCSDAGGVFNSTLGTCDVSAARPL